MIGDIALLVIGALFGGIAVGYVMARRTDRVRAADAERIHVLEERCAAIERLRTVWRENAEFWEKTAHAWERLRSADTDAAWDRDPDWWKRAD